MSEPAPIPISEWLECAKMEASSAAIMIQREGRLYWWRVGRDFLTIVRRSRTNHLELTGPSFWGLIATKHSLFPDPFPALYLID